MSTKKYRFNLSVAYKGADVERYKVVDLGDSFARVKDAYYKNGLLRVIVEGVYKYHDFLMEIETIWTLSQSQKTFAIITSTVEVDMFKLDWNIFIIPKDHMEALKTWHKTFKGVV